MCKKLKNMKLTIYDKTYSFSEIIRDEELIVQLQNLKTFDMPISMLTTDNAVFGWLEVIQQSDIDLSFIDFDHAFIKFEKI